MAELSGPTTPRPLGLLCAEGGFSLPKNRVLVGIDYAGMRREPGEVVDDIPRQSIGWLTEQGIIESVEDASGTSPASDSASGSISDPAAVSLASAPITETSAPTMAAI